MTKIHSDSPLFFTGLRLHWEDDRQQADGAYMASDGTIYAINIFSVNKFIIWQEKLLIITAKTKKIMKWY
jgi:hypothetical protein